MAADVIAALKAEIAGLEQQLATHRRALAILVGTASKATAAPTTPPARATAARRPSRRPARALAVQIQDYLAAHRGQHFTPAQLAEALQKTDKTVSRDNVQRRLSDMTKAKKVKRDNGRYSLPSA
jgi:outer membrane protein TolC